MSTHKNINKICVIAILISLIITVLLINGSTLGIRAAKKNFGYEERLFSTDRVHTIDIIIDDWDTFLSTAQSEEYSVCSVVIDDEMITNVGIRGKGNTSLSTVSRMDSDRYSFKIEFDQYDNTKTYHGLDKLCLNNLIQDNTYMKDYLTYQMMKEFGVTTPLCSYAYITVNGEDWGLYLAVEAVEESFLQRNYGNNYGELYKPDSMDFGGGRGNGKDFDMSDFMNQQEETLRSVFEELNLDSSVLDKLDFKNLTIETLQSTLSTFDEETVQRIMQAIMDNRNMNMPNMTKMGGMSSTEVKLQYIDDNPDSYTDIFNSAKTNVTEADQNRLISSLKQLSKYKNLNEVVNIDAVLRYFIIHNFVVNDDSYTGNMIHNYYLYEKNGCLSMIPWDYNLAFGTFRGNSAASVNDAIDTILSDRPMQAWIFSDDAYTQQYYKLYAEMLEQIDISAIIDNAYELITSYVEKDPTAFCSLSEFQTGVKTLKEFCSLRSKSVQLQLNGSSDTIATDNLNLSDMGTMNNGMEGFGVHGNFRDMQTPDGMPMPNGMQRPDDAQTSNNMQMPDGMQRPDDTQISDNMQMPDGMRRPDDTQISENAQTPDNIQIPDFKNMDNSDRTMPNNPSDSSTGTSILLIAASALVLSLGLLVAFKYKQ